MSENITSLLEPASLVIFGSFSSPAKVGTQLLENIIRFGYQGKIYLLSRSEGSYREFKFYHRLEEVPGPVDLGILAVPREAIEDVLTQCCQKEVGAVILVASGFGEADEWGTAAQRRIKELLDRSGIRAIGPNTVGFLNWRARLAPSFIPLEGWDGGPVAMASQTGNFAGCLVDEVLADPGQRLRVGLSVSLGNKLDIDELDILNYAAGHREFNVIGFHLESIKRGRDFFQRVRTVTPKKPVIILKTGRTEEGQKAAASHTASLAIDDVVVDGIMEQAGVIRATSTYDYLALLRAFSELPLPQVTHLPLRTGVVSFSGGSGVMTLDSLDRKLMVPADFSEETKSHLGKMLPPWQRVVNPFDGWMLLATGRKESQYEAFNTVLKDPRVDAVIGILVAVENSAYEGIGEVFSTFGAQYPQKPIVLVMHGGAVKQKWTRELAEVGIPVFYDTPVATRVLSALTRYAHWQKQAA